MRWPGDISHPDWRLTRYGGEECCLCTVIGSRLVVTENSQVTRPSPFTFMPSAQASLLCLVGFLHLINWLEYSMEGLWRKRNLQFGGCTLVDLQSLQDFLDWWRIHFATEFSSCSQALGWALGDPIHKNIPPQFLYIILIIWLPPLCFLAFLLPTFPLLNSMSPARYKWETYRLFTCESWSLCIHGHGAHPSKCSFSFHLLSSAPHTSQSYPPAILEPHVQ